MVQQVTQGLQQQDLKEPVGQRAMAAAHTLGFGKQQRKRVLDVGQRRRQQFSSGGRACTRGGGCRRQSQGGADKSLPSCGALCEVVCQRLRVEQQGGFVDHEGCAAHRCERRWVTRIAPRRSTCRKARPGSAAKCVTPQRPGMEGWARPKALQQGREPVDGVGCADGGAHGRSAMLGGRIASDDTDRAATVRAPPTDWSPPCPLALATCRRPRGGRRPGHRPRSAGGSRHPRLRPMASRSGPLTGQPAGSLTPSGAPCCWATTTCRRCVRAATSWPTRSRPSSMSGTASWAPRPSCWPASSTRGPVLPTPHIWAPCAGALGSGSSTPQTPVSTRPGF